MKNRDFEEFLRALRAGDARAAEELVHRYEPFIRRVVHMRLTDPRLRRAFDTVDVCQSVLAAFFALDAQGRLELSTPQRLRNLLVTMALNKFRDRVRREQLRPGSLPEEYEPAAADPTPGEQAEQQDLVEAVLARLSARERWLVEQRAQGRSWPDIARDTGEAHATLRMMHARAVARVREQLEREEVSRAR
jgi:RNA polymerase sigma factor (sigma-70 family)